MKVKSSRQADGDLTGMAYFRIEDFIPLLYKIKGVLFFYIFFSVVIPAAQESECSVLLPDTCYLYFAVVGTELAYLALYRYVLPVKLYAPEPPSG